MRPARRFARACLFPALVVLPALLLHVQHLGPGRIPYLRDLSRTHWPVKQLAVAALREGRLPQWNAAHGAGSPLLANANFFHFHPVSALFLLLPYPTAFSLGLALLSAAAALGTALWLREGGLSPPAAALGGFAFALGGLGASLTNLYNLLASYSAVPWALWAAERLARSPTPARAVWLALALAASLLGGEPSAFAMALLAAALCGAITRSRRAALLHALGALLALGLAAIQLLPLALATRSAIRGEGFTLEGSTWHSLPPARLLELVRPFPWGDPTRPWDPAWRGAALGDGGVPFLYSLYAGVTVMALALLGLGVARRGRAGLVALGGISLLLALGRFTPVYPWLWSQIDALHIFRYPSKYILGLFLALAALAARGADALLARVPRLPAALLPALAALELLAVHVDLVPGTRREPFLDPPPLARAVSGERVYFWLEPERWGSEERDRQAYYLDYQRRLIPPAGMPFGVRYVLDPDPDLLDSTRMVALGILFHRSDADRVRLLPLLAASRVHSPHRLQAAALEPLSGGQFLYAVRQAQPFAVLVPGTQVLPARDRTQAAQLLGDASFDPRRAAVFEGFAPPSRGPRRPVAVQRPRPEWMSLEVEGPGLLIVSEAFDAGWRAEIDARPAPLAAANLAFLGLPLPPGSHRVELRYELPGLEAGRSLTLSALCLALALLLRPRPRKETP